MATTLFGNLGRRLWKKVDIVLGVCTLILAGAAIQLSLTVGPFEYPRILLLSIGALVLSPVAILALAFNVSSQRSGKLVRALLMCSCVAVCAFLISGRAPRLLSVGFRRAIAARADLDRLQVAAVEFVRAREVGEGEIRLMRWPEIAASTEVPQPIRDLEPLYLDVVLDEDDGGFVRLRWGAAFAPASSLVVGPPGFVPASPARYYRLQDGIYTWVDSG